MKTMHETHRRGLLFILSAPAGTGKTTLIKRLMAEFPSVVLSLSFTTRQPRINETDGIDYNFISNQAFESKIGEGDFLEYVKLYDDYYGTSRDWVNQKLGEGRDVFLVIDTQGANIVRQKIDVPSIFVFPPSIDELRKRLINRATESSEMIEKRLQKASYEIKEACNYDYHIVNDDLEIAYNALKSILVAESHRNLAKTKEKKCLTI